MSSDSLKEFAALVASATGKTVEEVVYVIESMIDAEVKDAVEAELKTGEVDKLIKLLDRLLGERVKQQVDTEMKLHMSDYMRWMSEGGG